MRLNLGCGRQRLDGWVNVDHRSIPSADVVLDIDESWPWGPDSVEEIRAYHILEHIRDLPAFMDKAWGVLRKGGVLDVRVPHHRHRNADTDPTHVRRFTEHSFDYWNPESGFEPFTNKLWGGTVAEVCGGATIPILRRLPEWRYVYLKPPYELRWALTPLKE